MAHEYTVEASEPVFDGAVISVRRDLVAMPGGRGAWRDIVVHPGAVGVVAYEDGRILLLHQYRHPVRQRLWELPAGLLDVAGEPASTAAKRELAEEAGVQAARWDTLVDTYTSPGMSNEAIRIFLARDISELAEHYERVDEEADLEVRWVALDDAVQQVMNGAITNAMAVAGILSAALAAQSGFGALRPADAGWDARPAHAG
ncbi:MAG TPA: NUDIX hydrolase [Frankiaceae bacterium]|jgi:ADP-ribose pyrophosphatase|nr:NUDIX hydrolase [Frankiaceae bacterium]